MSTDGRRPRVRKPKIDPWSPKEVIGLVEDLLQDAIDGEGPNGQLRGGEIKPSFEVRDSVILVAPPDGARFLISVKQLP